MFYRDVILPGPFYRIQLFWLIEPVETTETETVYRNRLYMVDQHSEGGKILLKDQPAYSMPRLVEIPAREGL